MPFNHRTLIIISNMFAHQIYNNTNLKKNAFKVNSNL